MSPFKNSVTYCNPGIMQDANYDKIFISLLTLQKSFQKCVRKNRQILVLFLDSQLTNQNVFGEYCLYFYNWMDGDDIWCFILVGQIQRFKYYVWFEKKLKAKAGFSKYSNPRGGNIHIQTRTINTCHYHLNFLKTCYSRGIPQSFRL